MSIGLNHYQLLAAGKLYTELGERGEGATVTIDGKAFVDRDAALEAYRKNLEPSENKVTRWVDQKSTAVANRLQEALQKDTYIANKGRDVLDSKLFELNPEKVSYTARAAVRFADGHTETRDLEVTDVQASLALERLAISSLLLSAVPGVPFFVAASVAAAGTVASTAGWLVAVLARKGPLANAFGKTALKLFGLGVVGMTPILGSLPAAASIITDSRDVKRLNDQFPTAGAVATLRKEAAA
jgi:hypothetical protein